MNLTVQEFNSLILTFIGACLCIALIILVVYLIAVVRRVSIILKGNQENLRKTLKELPGTIQEVHKVSQTINGVTGAVSSAGASVWGFIIELVKAISNSFSKKQNDEAAAGEDK